MASRQTAVLAFAVLAIALAGGVQVTLADHEGPPERIDGVWEGGFVINTRHEIEVERTGTSSWTGKVLKASETGCSDYTSGSETDRTLAIGQKGEVVWKITKQTARDKWSGEVLVDPACAGNAAERTYWPAVFDIDGANGGMDVTVSDPADPADQIHEQYENEILAGGNVDDGTPGAVKPKKKKVGRKGKVKITYPVQQPTAFGVYTYDIYAVIKQGKQKRCNSRFGLYRQRAGSGARGKAVLAAKKGRALGRNASTNDYMVSKPGTSLDSASFGKRFKRWCKGTMHILVNEDYRLHGEAGSTATTVGRAKVKVKG